MSEDSQLKHVFFIQNFTTYIAVNSIIAKENISEENCVFLYGRGFSPSESGIKSIDLTPFTLKYVASFWKNWRKLYFNKKAIKRIIDKHLGPQYIFYFPVTIQYYVRMISDHPGCISVNAVEDGASAYWTKKERRNIFLKSTFSSLIYSFKIFCNHYFTYFPIHYFSYIKYFEHRFHNYYTLGEKGFTGYSNRIILKPKFKDELPVEFQNVKFLYAPAALVKKQIISLESYLGTLRELFTQVSEKYTKNTPLIVHYRFHPLSATNSKNMKLYKEVFESFDSIKFVEIPKDISLEKILYFNNATLISDISSLAVYAQAFNKKIIVYNHIISSFEGRYKREVALQPKVLQKIFAENELSK